MSTSRLHDIGFEFKALKTALDRKNEFAPRLIAFLKPDHFFNKATKTFFERLNQIVESGIKELPSFEILVDDSTFKDEVKEVLKAEYERTPVIKTKGDFEYITKTLSELSAARAIYRGAHKAATDLTEGDPTQPLDLTPILHSLESALLQAKSADEIGEQLILGAGYNLDAERVFNELLYIKRPDDLIKTGFKEFDERSGGFEKGNLVVIGANSGGGKSQFAINLMIRQYRLGYNVAIASYEMKGREIMSRVFSNISEVEMNKIRLQQMDESELKKVENSYRDFVLVGAEKGNYFRVDCPTSEETVQQVGSRLYNANRSNPPHVIIFDYINLLTTSSTYVDSQWQALGEIAREAKMLANQLNCVVVLLAQLDDTYNLRYAKAIKDHANFLMGWVRDEQAVLDNMVTVKQMKARNAPIYDFQLVTRFDIAQFRDLGELDVNKKYSEKEGETLLKAFKSHGFYTSDVFVPAAAAATRDVLTDPTLMGDDSEITNDALSQEDVDFDSVSSQKSSVILLKKTRKGSGG